MGCDIHAVVERKVTNRDEDGTPYSSRWVSAGDPDFGRNYELFAVLADVRNYDDIQPVSEPKGLPSFKGRHEEYGWLQWHDYDEKPSRLFEYHYEDNYEDAHSASWLSLAEIKAYDATQTVDDGRLVVGRGDGGAVTAVCRATTGAHEGPVGKRRIFTWPGEGDDKPTVWDRLIAYMENVRTFHDLSDEEVRLVFFFDN